MSYLMKRELVMGEYKEESAVNDFFKDAHDKELKRDRVKSVCWEKKELILNDDSIIKIIKT